MAKTKIVFLILPRIHLLDFAGAVQVFYEAMDTVTLDYCSIGDNIETSSEFPLGKLKNFREITFEPGDYLFVPGAEVSFLTSRKMTSQKELFSWVKAAHAKGVNICSVCTGAFFIGLTGLLNGRKCTTHWKHTEQLENKFPSIKLQEDILFAEDDGVFTSAGVTAGIDLALHILSKLTSESFSFKVARELVVYIRRHGGDSQQSVFMKYRNHIHSGIHKAQDYLQDYVHKKTSLDQLAEEACMSTRSLTRTFKKETGITINEYVTLIRKERLTELSKNPDMSRTQMARQCGLKSERQVIRLLKS